MSLILEALKKSEQQRQQQSATPQALHKRTLALSKRRPDRRSYWLLAGILPLALLCSWWFYSEPEPPTGEPLAAGASPGISQPQHPEPETARSAPAPVRPQPVVTIAEPAPVPSVYISPAPPVRQPPEQQQHSAAEPPPNHVDAAPEQSKADAPFGNADVMPAQAQLLDQPSLEPTAISMPRYFDLSKALRDRMPRLTMSMHYYNNDPARRLVRINDRLLHEGDWVSTDLELLEITPTGVILNFLGKSFEFIRSQR